MNATTPYEPPMLADVGDFTALTLGLPNWGFDWVLTCLIVGCHPV